MAVRAPAQAVLRSPGMRVRSALFAIGVVLVFHVAGMLWLYGMWHSYDMLMHFGGGGAMGVLALSLWDRYVKDVSFRTKSIFAKRIFFTLVVLGFTALVGIAWEWFEFAFDFFFVPVRSTWGLAQPSIADTMADLFLDLGGAFVVALLRMKV